MKAKFSLDTVMEDYNQHFLPFQKMSSSLIKAKKREFDCECELDKLQESPITDNQNNVHSSYRGTAKTKAMKKVKKIRTIAGWISIAPLVCSAAFLTRLFPNLLTPLLVGSMYFAIIILIIFFRSGYATRIEQKELAKLKLDRKYAKDLKKAKQEDAVATEKRIAELKEELLEIKKTISESDWIYPEWRKVADNIKSRAYNLGIARLIEDQPDAKIIDVVINKMAMFATPTTIKGLSYRDIMEEGKNKAINDWKECAYYIDKVDNTLKNL